MTRLKVQTPVRPFFNLIDDWFQEFPAKVQRDVASTLQSVPVNIIETSEGYHLEVYAPGRNKDEFNVNVEKDLLTISYEHKATEQAENLKVVRREFNQYSFKRSFSLDEKVDENGIQAKYEDGLLKLFLPKKEVVTIQPKQIAIQ